MLQLAVLKKITTVSEYELPIKVASQKGGGFVVTCPVWADCYAQGDTIDEAVLEITAVAQSLIELYKEEDLKIPLKLQGKRGVVKDFAIPIIVAS